MRRLIILIYNIILIPYKVLNRISVFTIIQDSQIAKKSAIKSKVKFYRSNIGRYSYISFGTYVESTSIGNFTSISDDCYIGGTSHPIDWVSTSPVFHKGGNVLKKNFSSHQFETTKKTTIGNDVWIGKGAIIKSGVKISDGAIIGMGSVVTHDVGPYEIWAGNPARLIRKRFDNETITSLLKLEWWNWNNKKIEKYAPLFNNPTEFIKGEEK